MSDSTVSDSNYSKHLEFYIHSVTFLVEDCLFRIPREPLEAESTVFRDMFLLPQGEPETVEGQNDTRPVILQGISKKDFECLLRALMHRQHGTNKGLDLDHGQWISVLKLSTMWEFNKLRNVAIKHLDPPSRPLNPVDKFLLASKYDIKEWLLPALLELVRRPEPISTEEARRLGLENLVRLAAVREQAEKMRTVGDFERDFTLTPRVQRSPSGPEDEEILNKFCTPLVCKVFNL